MTTHPTLAVLAHYATGGPGLDDATEWSVEVHLEGCPDCRGRLAGSTTERTRDLLDRVTAGLDREIAAGPPPAPLRPARSAGHRRWLAGTLLPWLAMTVAVLACAYVLEMLSPGMTPLVLLLAPLAPLPGVAVAWSRRTDPAWELIAGTPAAGLTMLLRRTAAVLGVVVPALALAGAGTGQSLALMLLPCLACTAATLALGGTVGVHRSAALVGAGWTAAVVLPAVLTADIPAVLRPASVPAWLLATAALAAVAATRSAGYRHLSSRN
jgi:hypothetical protein